MSSVIEIHMINNRPMLDEFIQMWNDVKVDRKTTIKVLTTSYDEKHFILNNGIKVEYIKQKTFPKTGYMNQAWARNELLCYVNSEFVLFLDDWQRPHPDILIEHLKYLRQGYIVSGKRIECDRNGQNCKNDSRDTENGNIRMNFPHFFWTCNGSVRRDDAVKVNGFDNYFCGGTGGEDFDFGTRVSRSGVAALYNPNAITYHYSHDDIPKNRNITMCSSHNLSPYKYIPEYNHHGDWNLMTSNEFEFWWEGHVKYYRCKLCNVVGILDSMQVYYFNRDNRITRVINGLEQVRGQLR